MLIPDRLIFKEGKVTIIDYKTGKEEESHIHQIGLYGDVLADMSYKVDKKIIVYIGGEISIRVL